MASKSSVVQAAVLGSVLLAPRVIAQETPATTPPPAPPPAPAPVDGATVEATGTEQEEGGGGISYDPQGRRDPFRPLTGEAADESECFFARGDVEPDNQTLTGCDRSHAGHLCNPAFTAAAT